MYMHCLLLLPTAQEDTVGTWTVMPNSCNHNHGAADGGLSKSPAAYGARVNPATASMAG
jgi:hypothetical protein